MYEKINNFSFDSDVHKGAESGCWDDKKEMCPKKRLGIFQFYDKDGVVGRYIGVYLESMLPYLEELVIVCNGKLSDEGRKSLEKYTGQIYVRDDIGSDGGAHQDIILNILGLDYIREFEELLLFNDTLYAPIGSWQPVFEKMDKTKADFWGLTQERFRWAPPYVQSYFLVFRGNILCSEDFAFFWENLDMETHDPQKIVADFEMNCTWFFEKKGYLWCTYSSCNDKRIFHEPYFFLAEEKLPVLKTRVFSAREDNFITDAEREKVRLYITDNSDYDMGMIVENLRHKEGRDLYHIERQKVEGTTVSKEIIGWQDIVSYASQYVECYLYGNTGISYALRNLLEPGTIKGIVVSDGYEQGGEQNHGIPIYGFSEVENKGEGLIVTLGWRNSKMLKDKILQKFPKAMFRWELED